MHALRQSKHFCVEAYILGGVAVEQFDCMCDGLRKIFVAAEAAASSSGNDDQLHMVKGNMG